MSDRTSILIVHPRPTRGGFTAIVMQARELISRGGVDVVVVSEDGARLSELPPEVRVEVLPNRLNSIRGVIALRRVVKHARPGLIHLHGRQAGVIGRVALPRRLRGTVLYTPHGTPWVGGALARALAGELLERLLLRRTRSVLCVSYSELADWTRRDCTNRIRYLPNPLPTAHPPIGVRTASSSAVRRVLVPSGYNPQKRLEVVVEALHLASSDDIELHFCGSVDRPEYRDALQRRVGELGLSRRVFFNGNLPDILTAMTDASLVVLPSFSEGMPIVAQQAILVEARVAWSRIPPHIELFGDAGAPFWTADELALIISGDHSRADVRARRESMDDERLRIERIRAQFWTETLDRSPATERWDSDAVPTAELARD